MKRTAKCKNCFLWGDCLINDFDPQANPIDLGCDAMEQGYDISDEDEDEEWEN